MRCSMRLGRSGGARQQHDNKPFLDALRQGINKQPPLATLKAYAQKTAGEVI